MKTYHTCVWIAGRGAEACTGRRQGATNSNAPLRPQAKYNSSCFVCCCAGHTLRLQHSRSPEY
eukprot:1126115-Pelagomonas_calceolata.AAC.1